MHNAPTRYGRYLWGTAPLPAKARPAYHSKRRLSAESLRCRKLRRALYFAKERYFTIASSTKFRINSRVATHKMGETSFALPRIVLTRQKKKNPAAMPYEML